MIKFIFVVTIVALLVIGEGFLLQYLWNWLMPLLFGLRQITFWQAVGLLVLSRILFASSWSSK